MNTLAEQVFLQSLESQKPSAVLKGVFDNSRILGQDFIIDLDDYPEVYIAGSGKASWEMVHTLCEELGDRVAAALAISSYDPGEMHPQIELHQSAHPVPDETSVAAGDKLSRFFEKVPGDALLLYAVSGGTSSLVCRPADGITIGELNTIYELLNNSGATIHEINTVRKHISLVKGGQLLRHVDPSATLVDLVISDVPNDNLQVIGSGPSTPDDSTFKEAKDILLKYNLWNRIPESARHHIEQGVEGTVPETVQPGEDPVKKHHSMIVGSARKLAQNAGKMLQDEGYRSWVAEEAYNEDVGQVAKSIAGKVTGNMKSSDQPAAFVFYGESTVDVTGTGKGGRNQELALRGALEIQGKDNITWLSAGTDGIDGPTDAAGAVVTGKTIAKAREMGLDPERYLENNDAYHFHQEVGSLLITGPTGNNLMDLQIVLVD
ncbi:DUF4147 domain-containing protein [Aliifodinibius sp. S!AR15-10]|uniref:glycerate kinase type-2 family protein n=1 Tax=Aliifodinibius sp. S!AR15-10 TaxID=2950437 RepID=UPI0028545AB4|nr:DUF4147 domain-containing protein [Aliifodinibius sp. S!AR15-10]MDR8392915.1 DUF4147 domain-containing protein [Aliifodinibius sp. S!AR15-10]